MPNKLKDLVKSAGTDIQPEAPLTRGRGLAGIIAEDTPPVQEAPKPPQADKSTSTQDDMTELKRPVKSFRLREDLTHQIEVLAAQDRRKLYELVEEALEEYLERRRQA
jgi:hypothetical protein